MKTSRLVVISSSSVIALAILFSIRGSAQAIVVDGIADSALQQIAAIQLVKQTFTPDQEKIDSGLVFSAKKARGELAATAIDTVATVVADDLASIVTVDIYGNVSPGLLATIASANGTVLDPSESLGMIRASLPLGSIETVAGDPDVKSIQTAAEFMTNVGSLTSQGYISHTANQVVNMGITGAGVTVGVLSDSALPAGVAARIASGDLPPTTVVLPGQQGPSNGTDEGIAMMEIVHDIAPGANLIFATAFAGVASCANNILALQAAGARVIVDDVTYSNEGAFQDGPIARAVSQVTANGAIYFSSAANSGSLTLGTSGTWEGDFQPNGPIGGPIGGIEPGTVHNFSTVASPQNFDVLTVPSSFISLKWSDPLGASRNDYDLFILNSNGTAVKGFSVGSQSGTQDPYEFVFQGVNCGLPTATGYCPAAGDRIVVVQFAGAPRALRIDTNRGQLSIATAGSTFGHNAGVSTVSTAATYWNSARMGTRPFTGATNPDEVFSSDG